MIGPTQPHRSPAELPLLLNDSRLAALLARSVRSVWRDHAQALLPRPVRVGGAVRWRRDEILSWIAAGCPSRVQWESPPAPILDSTNTSDPPLSGDVVGPR